jgi:hypothetical protein
MTPVEVNLPILDITSSRLVFHCHCFTSLTSCLPFPSFVISNFSLLAPPFSHFLVKLISPLPEAPRSDLSNSQRSQLRRLQHKRVELSLLFFSFLFFYFIFLRTTAAHRRYYQCCRSPRPSLSASSFCPRRVFSCLAFASRTRLPTPSTPGLFNNFSPTI